MAKGGGGGGRAAQTRILVVEDEADAREGLRMLLEASGYAVETAADGVDGLAKLLDGPPDAAVVDIDLPGLNGYELARRARAAPVSRRVRLIALTGFGRDKDRRAAQEAGFDRHLTKPISFSILRGALDGNEPPPPGPTSGAPPAPGSGSKTRGSGGNGAAAAKLHGSAGPAAPASLAPDRPVTIGAAATGSASSTEGPPLEAPQTEAARTDEGTSSAAARAAPLITA